MSKPNSQLVSDVRYFQLAQAKGAIKLEKVGMRHSSGRSARKMWAKNLGMKQNATHDEVIARIQQEMDTMLKEVSL